MLKALRTISIVVANGAVTAFLFNMISLEEAFTMLVICLLGITAHWAFDSSDY
tara:strand:+ start:818 stop:976 length:159 start_codon:yes stop_codon:yes gene_type:complete